MNLVSKKTTAGVAVAALGLTLAAGIGAAPKPEDAIEYRQGVLFALGWNVGEMGAMVKGEMPFDGERFAFLAERAAVLSPMAREGFLLSTKGSKSHALPKLWDNLDDFNERMKKLNAATQALATTAKAGDEGATKQQFGETVKVCKGCHDEFREKI